MMLDLAAVRLTRQKVNAGIWLCAALTMAASAISGVTAFYYLQQDGWGIASGAMTALAVDVALWVVLTGDRLMEAIGIVAGPWARAVRWGTASMSITLNVTAAAVANISSGAKPPLIILHVFVPLVMVALAELRGEYARKLAPAERDALAHIEAAERAADTPITRPSERISEEAELQRSLGPGGQPTTVTPLSFRSPSPTTEVARSAAHASDQRKQNTLNSQQRFDQQKQPYSKPSARSPLRTVPSGRGTPVRDTAFQWLDGQDPAEVTAAKLAAAIGGSPHTCKKLLAAWRAQQEVAS